MWENVNFPGGGKKLTLIEKVHVEPSAFSDEYILQTVQRFCEKLLAICPLHRIIFCESFYVDSYVTREGRIEKFDTQQRARGLKVNPWLMKLERLVLHFLEGCHVIYFPENVLADEIHHLHLAPTHYCENYYRYAYEKMKEITFGNWKFQAAEMLRIDNNEIRRLLERRL